ncbi:hypothetical protein CPB84DRAFT_1852524 [Gymnopilus junonius]|uniref:Uncharacterized protein n=1 Tax=Gymnopilus junonius TaxID=109634 RepID=A0A9P5NCT6_GYMJU|nr:hypothetical protein CPB84DRAFT_1852524 [Gymnopilus junonius]
MVALFVELINKIVEELDGDEPSLSACSLTSHSLLLMCRPIRFHKLSIDPVEHNAPISHAATSEMASIIIPHVRTLTLHWSNKIPSQSLDYTLNTILFIGKLTELQLRGRYKAVATSMVVDLAMMESLRTLSIDRLTDIPASIICNRPKLASFFFSIAPAVYEPLVSCITVASLPNLFSISLRVRVMGAVQFPGNIQQFLNGGGCTTLKEINIIFDYDVVFFSLATRNIGPVTNVAAPFTIKQLFSPEIHPQLRSASCRLEVVVNDEKLHRPQRVQNFKNHMRSQMKKLFPNPFPWVEVVSVMIERLEVQY